MHIYAYRTDYGSKLLYNCLYVKLSLRVTIEVKLKAAAQARWWIDELVATNYQLALGGLLQQIKCAVCMRSCTAVHGIRRSSGYHWRNANYKF